MALLAEKLKDKRIILASRSPRRRELMTGAGFEFTVADNYDVEEIYPEDMPASAVAEYLAGLKSHAYPQMLAADEILITADTVVVLDGKVLGKPDGRESAVKMLGELSGKMHTVITGVALRTADKFLSFSAKSDVWFRELKAEEIEYYVDKYRPFDKAGAYGIQEWIGYAAIEKIEGSFYNVMGLPIQTLYVTLEKFIGRGK